MFWHLLAHWLSFFFPVFYKKIEGRNIHYLHKKGPAIIAMNHPNAFTDPIIISHLTYPLRLKYMARGDAFKPGLVTFLLESMGIVPIYRMRDGGKEGLKKNDESYQRVNALLGKNKKVIVFAEGLCVQERRLRPLKKGVARMVFGAYEFLQNDSLTIIPVGINYNQPDAFRSKVFYNVGEPIPVKDYVELYRENPARAQTKLLTDLSQRMKELITHVDNPVNDVAMLQIETLCMEDRLREKQLKPTLANELTVLKELTHTLNQGEQHHPGIVSEFREKAAEYFHLLKTHRLRDWVIRPGHQSSINTFGITFRLFILFLGAPLYLAAFLLNYPAMFLTHAITSRRIKSVEFYSSVAIGIAMLLFTIQYAIWFILASQIVESVFGPYLVCLFAFLSGWFALFYYPYFKKTRALLYCLIHKDIYAMLRQKREVLVAILNKF